MRKREDCERLIRYQASSLRQPHESLRTGKPRVAYTDQTLVRAITQGLDAGSESLHSGMPRYRLSDQQAGALVAYLKKIGTDDDTDPGVTATTITVQGAGSAMRQ